mmetsp:Transcript_23513/g.65651  ORF Transcript_23513/g.65651 Transcript_23513/m.65651 type:complete len:96 (-) Transcript_23513:48-335(-)
MAMFKSSSKLTTMCHLRIDGEWCGVRCYCVVMILQWSEGMECACCEERRTMHELVLAHHRTMQQQQQQQQQWTHCQVPRQLSPSSTVQYTPAHNM